MSSSIVDLLVLGATGFTGRLITRYLHSHRERESFSFAIAGRSKSKLVDMVVSLELQTSVPIFTVDVAKCDEIDSVVRKAKVVINTVGPYTKWGKSVVGACARNGVHYVDLTAETPFVLDIITEFDFLATKTKSVIIPSCGFDSVSSDILAYLSAQTLSKATNGTIGAAKSHTVYRMIAGVSGGTIASMLSLIEDTPLAKLKIAMKPFAISPVKGKQQPGSFIHSLPRVPGQKAIYGSIFPLAPQNIATVQRTWGLLQLYKARAVGRVGRAQTADDAVKPLPYGDDFTYGESMQAPSLISAVLFSFVIATILAGLFFLSPFRWMLRKIAPKPGDGPSDEEMERGFFNGRNITESTLPPETKKSIFVESNISGVGDPGYSLTAVMVVESALSLLNISKLTPLAQEGGVLTPMSALGDVLIERLKATGKFDIDSEVLEIE